MLFLPGTLWQGSHLPDPLEYPCPKTFLGTAYTASLPGWSDTPVALQVCTCGVPAVRSPASLLSFSLAGVSVEDLTLLRVALSFEIQVELATSPGLCEGWVQLPRFGWESSGLLKPRWYTPPFESKEEALIVSELPLEFFPCLKNCCTFEAV